jgi:hypothetical protein
LPRLPVVPALAPVGRVPVGNISVLSDDQTFEDTHDATDAFIGAFAEIRAGT